MFFFLCLVFLTFCYLSAVVGLVAEFGMVCLQCWAQNIILALEFGN